MPSRSATLRSGWEPTVLPASYINPDKLKEYLNKKFDKNKYRVKVVRDQYYIDTSPVLSEAEVSEIRNLKTNLPNNPEAEEGESKSATDGKEDNTTSNAASTEPGLKTSLARAQTVNEGGWKNILQRISRSRA